MKTSILLLCKALTYLCGCSTDDPGDTLDQTFAGVFMLVKAESSELADLAGPDEPLMIRPIEKFYEYPQVTGRLVLKPGPVSRLLTESDTIIAGTMSIDVHMPSEAIYLNGEYAVKDSTTMDTFYEKLDYHGSHLHGYSYKKYAWQGHIMRMDFGMFNTNITYVFYWERL